MTGPEMIGRVLLVIAGIIAVTGLAFFVLGRFGLGRLPGDIFIQRENITFYFPLTTGIIISLVLSLLLWFFARR